MGMSEDADEARGNRDVVWHYTDGAGLKSMLQNKVLWAGSAAYMNDFKELITGNDVLNKIYGEVREQSPDDHEELRRLVTDFIPPREDNFILSATSDSDSLTMWRYYGKDQVSFAIGLDRHAALRVRAQRKEHRHPDPPAGYYDGYKDDWGNLEEDPDQNGQIVEGWKAMIYDEQRQKEIIRKALEDLSSAVQQAKNSTESFSLGVAFKKLSLLAELYRIKHKGFRDEKELRILAQAFPAWKYVLHRPGRYGMIPYVELGMPARGDDGMSLDFEGDRQRMDRLPIKHINIGPTPYPEEARFGLKQLLSFNGYHDVKVAVSTIPYR